MASSTVLFAPKGTKTTPRGPNKSQEPPKPSGLAREEKLEAVKLLIRQLVTRDSGLAGLLLWVPISLGREDLQAYAYTDGVTTYYCDAFFTLPAEEQRAVIIHELLHI